MGIRVIGKTRLDAKLPRGVVLYNNSLPYGAPLSGSNLSLYVGSFAAQEVNRLYRVTMNYPGIYRYSGTSTIDVSFSCRSYTGFAVPSEGFTTSNTVLHARRYLPVESTGVNFNHSPFIQYDIPGAAATGFRIWAIVFMTVGSGSIGIQSGGNLIVEDVGPKQ
ncbi:hypothetical protein ABZY93_22055 [Streptomyces smyrnaeus]|uniref:hypothetical protein n=1 Tax=Streptomyces smyrnaeus TaxID=1387713 RepID=UPI00339E83AA